MIRSANLNEYFQTCLKPYLKEVCNKKREDPGKDRKEFTVNRKKIRLKVPATFQVEGLSLLAMVTTTL